MVNISQFPSDRGTDSLKSFWRLSNPARPDIDAIRVEHNEDYGLFTRFTPKIANDAALALFLPAKVASYLGFDIAAAPVDIVLAPDSSTGPLPRIGPIRAEWVGTLDQDRARGADANTLPEREPYVTHAYVWQGRTLIAPALVLKA